MNDQTTNLLAQLAAKLGTTTKYLWQIMLNQARITAIEDVVLMAVCAIVITLTVVLFVQINKEDSNFDTDDAPGMFLIIISIIASLFCGIAFICLTVELINATCNPEYWALHEILTSLAK